MIRAALSLVLFCAFSPLAAAQIRISIPLQSFRINDKIPAKVENTTSGPVTFCIEIGQRSTNGTITEATPVPFVAQTSSEGRWRTLLIWPRCGKFAPPHCSGARKIRRISISAWRAWPHAAFVGILDGLEPRIGLFEATEAGSQGQIQTIYDIDECRGIKFTSAFSVPLPLPPQTVLTALVERSAIPISSRPSSRNVSPAAQFAPRDARNAPPVG
jgi:hypothetical protein